MSSIETQLVPNPATNIVAKSTTKGSDQQPEFGGPHPWQTHSWARLVRKSLRQKEYLRWVDEYCTSVTVKGQEHLESINGPAIFIANHQSHMDTPVLMSALTPAIQNNIFFGAAADRWFVKGKKKLILQPWYQSLALGNFPIIRGGGSKTLDYAKWLIDQDCNICIFPEGTRAKDNQLGKFRPGVALLALEKRIPVVPILLKGLRELRPKGAREITPGPVSATIMEPQYLTRDLGVEGATEHLWKMMSAEFFQKIPFPESTAANPDSKASSTIVKAA